MKITIERRRGMTKWVTWEYFEDTFNLPARSYSERCNFNNYMIYIGIETKGEGE